MSQSQGLAKTKSGKEDELIREVANRPMVTPDISTTQRRELETGQIFVKHISNLTLVEGK